MFNRFPFPVFSHSHTNRATFLTDAMNFFSSGCCVCDVWVLPGQRWLLLFFCAFSIHRVVRVCVGERSEQYYVSVHVSLPRGVRGNKTLTLSSPQWNVCNSWPWWFSPSNKKLIETTWKKKYENESKFHENGWLAPKWAPRPFSTLFWRAKYEMHLF